MHHVTTAVCPVYLQGRVDTQVYEADDEFGPEVHRNALWYLYILKVTWTHTPSISITL